MKRTALNAFLVAAGIAIAGASHAAPPDHAHGHDAPATLQLNAGKKWPTDAALRQSMGNNRQSVAGALQDIHEDRLAPAAYNALAHKIEGVVGQIVANCKLEPQADAQLHLIVAALLEGADQMAGQAKSGKRRDGAIKVIGALENYSGYFDDPLFKPIAH